MQALTPKFALFTTIVGTLLGAGIMSSACSDTNAGQALQTRVEDVATSSTVDSPLDVARLELLQLAYDSASAMPLNPHVKNRSRSQALVVEACLELGQAGRALNYVEGIADWRRGAGYADYALVCAQRGDVARSTDYIGRALKQAESLAANEDQSWRTGRILAKVASAQIALGQLETARGLREQLEPAEAAIVDAALTSILSAEQLEQKLAEVEGVVAVGDFEGMRAALAMCAQWYERCYADSEARDRIEAKIKASWTKLPLLVRIETLEQLVQFALAHEDREKALELCAQAQAIFDTATWMPEDQIAVAARLAEMRQRSGDAVGARRQADALLALYEVSGSRIVDIHRAGALRALAGLYHALGERELATSVYRRAIEAGVDNPNSRPRAEDLTATCLSMVRCGFVPDAALLARIQQIQAALGAPW